MLLFRITKAIYADKLVASGIENRWNGQGKFVIYAASTAALACLENLVHTSGKLLYTTQYRLVVIEVPDKASHMVVDRTDLPSEWQQLKHQSTTQAMGNQWYDARKNLLLEIPSAIIPSEKNFLINTAHTDFKKAKILRAEPFLFDPRLKMM